MATRRSRPLHDRRFPERNRIPVANVNHPGTTRLLDASKYAVMREGHPAGAAADEPRADRRGSPAGHFCVFFPTRCFPLAPTLGGGSRPCN